VTRRRRAPAVTARRGPAHRGDSDLGQDQGRRRRGNCFVARASSVRGHRLGRRRACRLRARRRRPQNQLVRRLPNSDATRTVGGRSVDDPGEVPPDATPFDMRGAELGHHGGDFTFETILRRYDLDDPVLCDLARIVHEADLEDERYDAPEAPGLDVICRGLSMVRRSCRSQPLVRRAVRAPPPGPHSRSVKWGPPTTPTHARTAYIVGGLTGACDPPPAAADHSSRRTSRVLGCSERSRG
jgi:chromate resistance exported protein